MYPSSRLSLLLYPEVCLLAAVAGILAQRHPGPGLTLLGLVWLLDCPRSFSPKRSLCFFSAFACAFAYSAWRAPKAPPVPEWLRGAAYAAEDSRGELRPPGLLRIRARVESSAPLWRDRARMILSHAVPVDRPVEKNGTVPGRDADEYQGGIVWTWDKADVLPLPGQWVEATLRLSPQRGLRNPGGWDTDRYWADKGVWFRATSGMRTGFRVLPRNVREADSRFSGLAEAGNRLRENLRQRYIACLPREAAQGTDGDTRPGQGAAILPALVFGDRSWLDERQTDLFARSTLAHSLALSGLHLGFALLVGLALARGLARLSPGLLLRIPRPKLALLLSLPPALLYLWLGQAPLSLLRAACMLFFWALLLFLRRPRVLLDGLLAAVACLLLLNPLALFDLGFQLSVLSVASISLCLPGLARLAERVCPSDKRSGRRGRMARGAILLAGTSLCVQLALLPLILRAFGGSGLLFPLNLVWLPLLGLFVMPLAFLGLPLAALGWDALARGTLFLATLPCEGLTELLGLLDGAGLLVAPLLPRPHWLSSGGYWLLCLALPGIAAWSVSRSGKRENSPVKRWKGYLGLTAAGLALLLAMPVAALVEKSRAGVRLRLLDVGQGQSVLIEWSGLGPERASGRLLVDGGGFSLRGFDVGKGIVAPLLTDNALPRLDLVINSHPDTDHLAGLLFLLARFRIGGYYGNGDTPAPELAAREKAALAAGGADKKVLAAEDSLELAPELRLEVLWPPARTDAVRAYGGADFARKGADAPMARPEAPKRTRPGKKKEEGYGVDELSEVAWSKGATKAGPEKGNNASLVLRLLWRDTPLALLCGDAGTPVLHALAAKRGTDLAAQVLLMPHHGSASALTPALYAAVDPKLALVACGYANRFGFPSAAVRRELSRRGIPLYSTAASGQISVNWTDPGSGCTLDFARPEALPEQPPGGPNQ